MARFVALNKAIVEGVFAETLVNLDQVAYIVPRLHVGEWTEVYFTSGLKIEVMESPLEIASPITHGKH